MTSNKITPGPWKWSDDDNGNRNGRDALDPDILYATYTCTIIVGDADARLIEAAPDLLSALLVALEALDAVGRDITVGERYTEAGQKLIDALPAVRAAIGKAVRS